MPRALATRLLENSMSQTIPKDRFLGCLLGQAVGDALGAPYEGLPADTIYWSFGPVHELLAEPTTETLHYTDDTQMMIGVAETLVRHGEILQDDLAQQFAANYQPERGYGQGARRILECLAEGGAWQQLADTVFPGGSFGNGAAPVGLLLCHDLERVADEARGLGPADAPSPAGNRRRPNSFAP